MRCYLFAIAYCSALACAYWFSPELAIYHKNNDGVKNAVLFSNDGPFGAVASDNESVWNCDMFYWNDLNFLGNTEPISFYGFSFMMRFFPTPLLLWLVGWAIAIACARDKAKRTMKAVLWTIGAIEAVLITILMGCWTDRMADKAWWLCLAMRLGATTMIVSGCIIASLPDRVKGRFAP